MRESLPGLLRAGLMALAGLLVPALAFAIVPPDAPSLVPAFSAPELKVGASTVRHPVGAADAAARPGVDHFFQAFSENWEVHWDLRGDRPHLIQGTGAPLFPGRGNSLDGAPPTGLPEVALHLRGFLAEFSDLFRISQEELILDEEASGSYQGYYWNVEFQQRHDGVPVAGAKIFFRINNGNLVQLGADLVASIRHLDTHPRLSRQEALAVVLGEAQVGSHEVTVLDPGTLRIFPALLGHEHPGQRYEGVPGLGYRHILGWELTFRRQGEPATYEAVVDARSGRLLRLVDRNRYAQVTGGIFPESNLDTEEVRGMPYCSVSDDGGTHVTDAGGTFTSGGGTHYVRLDGRYVSISDDCGSIERSTRGDPALGSSSGTDCTTPGYGGAGNTHAARTSFYHLSRINRQADAYYPSNTWLDGTLTANTNIADDPWCGAYGSPYYCNAYWDGSEVNFIQSGCGCANTGELSDVIFHEWGHGFDDNTGGPAGEDGSGEAVGDTFAFLQNRNSCIGEGFTTSNCHNCDSCTGVREMGPFSLDGSATLASPDSVEDNNGIDCDRWSCPLSYSGPMGYEGHCESYIASTANWDLARNLVSAYGTEDGWAEMERIWYGSMQPGQSAYRVTSGGQCNPSASVDGCGSDNWYTVFLSVDDDDGNLGNGTPNGCRIWDAYQAHGIECGSRPACTEPSYPYRIYPYSSSGYNCKRTNTWFNYGGCSAYKEYHVTAGSWLGLYAYGDSCPGCVLWHINFQIQEDFGSGWVTTETHNPGADFRGMIYTTSYVPSTGKIRIYAPQGFYVKVFEQGIPNGGFETGSAANGWLVKAYQPYPSITSNPTYVANRGTYSLGNTGSGTYGGSDSLLWGYGKDVPELEITPSSKLYFDTYGATYSQYAHHHVKVWWTTGGTTTYDTYVCCYNTGIPSGWSQQVFDFPDSAHGRAINKVEITFHKDHSSVGRYKPTIYIDNISLR